MKVVEVSSNNQYKTDPFNRGDKLTARHLETLRDSARGNVQIRNPDNFVKRLPGGHILTSKKRSKPGGGTTFLYVEIQSANNKNSYEVQEYDNPVDHNIVGDEFTVLAIQHDFGTLPNTPDGQGFWITVKPDGNYYFEPSLFYGT